MISAFVICFLDSIMTPLATGKISIFWLVFVAEQADLNLKWSETTKTGFPYNFFQKEFICGNKRQQNVASAKHLFNIQHYKICACTILKIIYQNINGIFTDISVSDLQISHFFLFLLFWPFLTIFLLFSRKLLLLKLFCPKITKIFIEKNYASFSCF